MKGFNYAFIAIVILMLIVSAMGMFFMDGYTSKNLSIVILVMAVCMLTNGIRTNFFQKHGEKDERNISIENKAKAKAFDIMGIIFGILIIVYGILKYNLLIILLAASAYCLIFIVYMVCFSKYHKEM